MSDDTEQQCGCLCCIYARVRYQMKHLAIISEERGDKHDLDGERAIGAMLRALAAEKGVLDAMHALGHAAEEAFGVTDTGKDPDDDAIVASVTAQLEALTSVFAIVYIALYAELMGGWSNLNKPDEVKRIYNEIVETFEAERRGLIEAMINAEGQPLTMAPPTPGETMH